MLHSMYLTVIYLVQNFFLITCLQTTKDRPYPSQITEGSFFFFFFFLLFFIFLLIIETGIDKRKPEKAKVTPSLRYVLS